MIFVKPSSEAREKKQELENAAQEQIGPADEETDGIEDDSDHIADSSGGSQPMPEQELPEISIQEETSGTDERPAVSVKSGIDPEDEFFVEPRVGAIYKNMPLIDLVEEQSQAEEEQDGGTERGLLETETTGETAGYTGTLISELADQKEAADDRKEVLNGTTDAAAAEEGKAVTESSETEALKPAAKPAGRSKGDSEPDFFEGAGTDGAAHPDVEYEPLFCMACGKPLPEGAAFCDACGTQTGAVSPAEIRSRRQSKQGLAFGLLADFFIKPESTIERAADEDACLSGAGFFLLKDVILAVLAAAFMKKITVSLGLLGPWLTGGDSFGFAAKVFLCAIVADALWVGILFGAGYLFRTDCPIKILIGACGTASLLPAGLLIITTLLVAFVPVVAVEAIVVTILVTLIVMTKAAAAAFIPPQDRLLYLMAASTAVYAILLVAAVHLIDIPLFG